MALLLFCIRKRLSFSTGSSASPGTPVPQDHASTRDRKYCFLEAKYVNKYSRIANYRAAAKIILEFLGQAMEAV